MPAPRYMTGPGTLESILANQPTYAAPRQGWKAIPLNYWGDDGQAQLKLEQTMQGLGGFQANDGNFYVDPAKWDKWDASNKPDYAGHLAMVAGILGGMAGGAGLMGTLGGAGAGAAGVAGETGIAGLTAADLAGEGLFTGLTDAQLAGSAGGFGGLGGADAAWGVNPIADTGIQGLTQADLAGTGNFTGLTDAQLASYPGGTAGSGSLADFMKNFQQNNPSSKAFSELFQQLDNAGGNGQPFPGFGQVAQAGGGAISRLLNGDASTQDWMKLLTSLGSTGLGLAGANAQTGALNDVYDKQMALGAPSRARFEGSFAPGFNLATGDPGFQQALATSGDVATRAAGAKYGNPAESPGAMAEIQKYILGSTYLPQLNTYRSQNLTGGQLGTNTAGTAALGGAQASGGMYNALGSGLAQLTAPDNSLASLMKQLNDLNLNMGGKVP